MRTLCVLVADTKEVHKAINEITNFFPCFIQYKTFEDNTLELTIDCREEDAGAIERRLGRLV